MFKEDIERTIGKVLKDNGHKSIPVSKYCIYYIKRYSDKLGFYIRCSDNRHHNGGISIQMFFTAIQIPDDRIVTYSAGLDIHILTIYRDITDEIFVGAGKKVIAIESNMGNLSDTVLEELESPFLPQKRSQIVRKVLTIYDMISKEWNDELSALRSKAYKAVKKKRYTEIFQLCSDFIDNLPTDYFQGIVSDMDLHTIKNEFSEQIRAQCLFDWGKD